jgi:hypothetical protein
MRQIEDRHGLSPRALLQLRWVIAPAGDEGVVSPEPAPRPQRDRRAQILKLVTES